MSRLMYKAQINAKIDSLKIEIAELEKQIYKPGFKINDAWFDLRGKWDSKKHDLAAQNSRLRYLNRPRMIEETIIINDNNK